MKWPRKLLRFGLIIIAAMLILDVIQHPSGQGNTACYPSLTCYHHSYLRSHHTSRARS